MNENLKFWGVVLICFLLIMVGVYAENSLTTAKPIDVKSIDAKTYDFKMVAVQDASKSVNVVLDVSYFDIAKFKDKFYEFNWLRKVSYSQKQFDDCLKKRTKEYCKGLALKQMEKVKNNILKQNRERLEKLLSSVK